MPYVAHLAQKQWRQEKERKQFLHTFHKTKAEDGEEVESTVKKNNVRSHRCEVCWEKQLKLPESVIQGLIHM